MDCSEGLIAGGHAADNLHQRHYRHGVEEVHADDLLGTARLGGQLGDGDGGGVGGQDGAFRQNAVERGEELGLQIEALRGGFNSEIRQAERLMVQGRLNAVQGRLNLRLGQLAFDGLAAQVGANPQ